MPSVLFNTSRFSSKIQRITSSVAFASATFSLLAFAPKLSSADTTHVVARGHTIEAIANEVGYEDAGFFTRLFRRKVNLTPAAYRRRFSAMRKGLQG